MASTGYKSRVIIKEAAANEENFAGTYKLLMAAKSIPSPTGTPSNVESTTLEDDTQTFEPGVKQTSQKDITGNLEKEYMKNIKDLKNKNVDVMHLYGTDGVGGVSKWAYQAKVDFSVSDLTGTDQILEMTATVTPTTASKEVVDDYTVVDNEDGTFTVTKKA